MRLGILILLSAILFGCEDHSELDNQFYVTVYEEGLDCGLLLIDFNPDDLSRLEEITATENELRFYALNLDKEIYSENDKISVLIRRTMESELLPCKTQFASFPWVTILSVNGYSK